MLAGVSLTIRKGRSAGIVGLSGSGKTTFLAVLAGLRRAAGVARIDDFIASLSGEFETLIVVAHRLSTVERRDEIHVIDQGRVVGGGAHAVLLQSCPAFGALYQTQSPGAENLVHAV